MANWSAKVLLLPFGSKTSELRNHLCKRFNVALLTVRHASRNCRKAYLISDAEQVIAVVSRNDANEQESVVVYKP